MLRVLVHKLLIQNKSVSGKACVPKNVLVRLLFFPPPTMLK